MMINAAQMSGIGRPQPPERAEAFKSIDNNGDGSFNKEELSTLGEKFSSDTGMAFDLDAIMDQFDNDGDGSLSEEEGLALLDNLKEMAGGSPPPRPGQQGVAGFEDQYRANANAAGYSMSLLEILA